MSDQTGEKRHPATENKLRKLKQEGQWYASGELTAAALIATMALMWSSALPVFGRRLVELAVTVWQPERLASPDPLRALDESIRQSATSAALIIAMVLVAMLCVAALIRFLQVGPMFSVKPLWRVENLNPVSGFKKIFFTGQTYQKFAIGLVKAALMMGLVAAVVWAAIRQLLYSGRVGPMATVSVFNGIMTTFLWEAAALYILFGAADYFIQRKHFDKENRMTDEELRDDMKETEGNPEVKARMRHMQRQMAAAEQAPTRKLGGLLQKLLGKKD